MFRYAVVYIFGGVYTDVDTDCITPISAWNVTGCDLFIGLENDLHFCQWTFAATARSPYLKYVIDAIVGRFELMNGVDASNPNFVHNHTGPAIFTQSLKELFAEHLNLQDVAHSWDARQWFVNLRKKKYTAPHRICIRDYPFFNSEHVQNNYASQKQYNNWTSWTHAASVWQLSAGSQ